MMRSIVTRTALALTAVLSALVLTGTPARAQAPIESELNLITPVSKFIHDAALKAFAEQKLAERFLRAVEAARDRGAELGGQMGRD